MLWNITQGLRPEWILCFNTFTRDIYFKPYFKYFVCSAGSTSYFTNFRNEIMKVFKVTPLSLVEVCRCFEGTEYLHFQHQRVNQASINKIELSVYIGQGRGYETSSSSKEKNVGMCSLKWAVFHLKNERWEKMEPDLPVGDVGRARE
jgi:hypothetical protein